MPLYEFRCPRCGSFEAHRDLTHAGGPTPCPSCAAPAPRVYTAPRTSPRSGSLSGASRADRARIDRARSGEPTITSAPRGRRLPSAGHRH